MGGSQTFTMAIGTAFCVLSAINPMKAYAWLILEGGCVGYVLVWFMLRR